MAKAKKVIEKPQVAQMAQTPDSLAEIAEMPKVFVPDVPAQVIEEKPAIVAVKVEDKKLTEIEFLKIILHRQHEGGFGRHLDELINDRIKLLS